MSREELADATFKTITEPMAAQLKLDTILHLVDNYARNTGHDATAAA